MLTSLQKKNENNGYWPTLLSKFYLLSVLKGQIPFSFFNHNANFLFWDNWKKELSCNIENNGNKINRKCQQAIPFLKVSFTMEKKKKSVVMPTDYIQLSPSKFNLFRLNLSHKTSKYFVRAVVLNLCSFDPWKLCQGHIKEK